MMNIFRQIYRTQDGHAPYEEWLENLRDRAGRAKIKVRIDRALLGNFGNHRTVGAGVIELKVDFGPGYRIYLAQHGEVLIVLLCGGDKCTQDRDIVKARAYWEDYKIRL